MAIESHNQVNTFEKGLNQDVHPLRVPNNQYLDALNMRLVNIDGNSFQFQNIDGTTHMRRIPGNITYPIGNEDFDNIIFVLYCNEDEQRYGLAMWVDGSLKGRCIQRQITLGTLGSWTPVTQSDVDLANTNGEFIRLIEDVNFNFSRSFGAHGFRIAAVARGTEDLCGRG